MWRIAFATLNAPSVVVPPTAEARWFPNEDYYEERNQRLIMFGRQPKEEQSPEDFEVGDIMFPSDSEIEDGLEEDTELSKLSKKEQVSLDKNNPEIVNIVEKISGIISPYFIVIVGLVLSDDNFLLGLLLIAVGILSLLKISWRDILGVFLDIKDGLSSDD